MSFEGHRLNDMIDLVEQAKPADLESAGDALKNARDAIAAAAKELDKHIKGADWQGEAASAFKAWGLNLVKDAHRLADYADTAGVQIASAGAGLASVRSSMPPRDQRADPKMLEDIPTPKRVDGNAEYDAAAKAENHRQEAINQMNRLSSFYQVSQHSMAGQEPPTFSAMPNVGVPRPVLSDDGLGGGGREAASSTALPAAAQERTPGPVDTAMSDPAPSDDSSPPRIAERGPITAPGGLNVTPDPSVGTEIDSVGTLPPQTVSPAHGSPPPGPGPTGIGGEPVPPLGGGLRNPAISGPVTRTSAPARSSKLPLPAQGRTTGPAGPAGGPGRAPSSPSGRAGQTATGRSLSGPTATGQPPLGRAVTGGTPRPNEGVGPRSGMPGTGAGRANGVVGGRPVSGPASTSSKSGMSRGPVVGAEGAGGSRTTGGGGNQRGVVGATPQGRPANGGQLPRRSTANADGVVGAPRGRVPTRGSGKDGFTAGGAGLVRGSGSNRQHSDLDEDEGSQRPGHLVEDEETHLPSSRRQVPPVID